MFHEETIEKEDGLECWAFIVSDHKQGGISISDLAELKHLENIWKERGYKINFFKKPEGRGDRSICVKFI